MSEAVNNSTRKGLRIVTSIAMILAVFSIFWLGIRLLTDPLPYEYKNLTYQENIQVCPGDSFPYAVDILINKTPITVVKSEVLFSLDAEKPENFFYDKVGDREIFPWGEMTPAVIHRENRVYVPVKNVFNQNLSSGKFVYVSNLNSEGIRSTASISIPFTIPESCFKN